MRDEGARFSSRPGSMEDSTGDGYAFTLRGAPPVPDQADVGDERRPARPARPRLPGRAGPDARRHGRRAARAGGGRVRRAPAALLHGPTPTATPSPRAPRPWRNLLGAAPELVYYPDSRIVTGTPNVADALRRAEVRYLVVDAGESKDGQQLPDTRLANVVPPLNAESGGPLGELAVPVAGPGLRHQGPVHRPGDEGRAVRGVRPGGRPGQGRRSASGASSSSWPPSPCCAAATCSSTATTPTRPAGTAGSTASTTAVRCSTTASTRRRCRGSRRTRGCSR